MQNPVGFGRLAIGVSTFCICVPSTKYTGSRRVPLRPDGGHLKIVDNVKYPEGLTIAVG